MFKELRVAPLADSPYKVHLIFIISEDGLPKGGDLALGRFVSHMKEWFDPAKASLVAWNAANLYEISAGHYMDTRQIYLDHHTYQGETITGLVPPPYPM
jgi:hypothetical protein